MGVFLSFCDLKGGGSLVFVTVSLCGEAADLVSAVNIVAVRSAICHNGGRGL